MLFFREEQIERLGAICFFVRLSEFLFRNARNTALREAVMDQDEMFAFWSKQWPLVKAACEHDAAVFLSFMSACRAEGLDLHLASKLASECNEYAELNMKRFLSERGYLRFSDFDFAEEIPLGQEN